MIEIKVLGAGQEVGRSAFLVDTGVEKFLLDYGLNGQNFAVPIQPPPGLDGVFISHAHLDHCGMVPELYRRGYAKNIFGTQTTLELSNLLLHDSLGIQARRGIEPLYLNSDLQKAKHNSKALGFNQPVEFSKSKVELRDAGHIPGSSSILVDAGTKRLLYTGDLKYLETKLMRPADTNFKDIDALVIESTYSYANHPDRNELAEDLLVNIKRVLDNNGTVLLPSFAIGRTQEMLLILQDLNVPIYLDGMGIDATQIVLNNPGSIKDPEKLKKAFGKARKVEGPADRQNALKESCVVIASAGMLQGGPMHYYVKKLYKKENCMLVFNGYQVEGTTGRSVLEKHRFIENGNSVDVKMEIQFMDFSAHIGKDNLFKFIGQVNPSKVIAVHGGKIDDFVKELKQKGFDASGPKNGDIIKV